MKTMDEGMQAHEAKDRFCITPQTELRDYIAIMDVASQNSPKVISKTVCRSKVIDNEAVYQSDPGDEQPDCDCPRTYSDDGELLATRCKESVFECLGINPTKRTSRYL